MPWTHALRDLALLGLTALLWWLDATVRGSGALAVAVGVVTGAATAVAGYLAHEWGHLIGARLGGSVVRLPASPAEVFLFNFDSDRNSRAQFLTMSCGGYAASVLVVALLVATLPLATIAGTVALGLTAAGVLATAILEIPPFVRVWQGGPIPRGAAYVSAATPERDRAPH